MGPLLDTDDSAVAAEAALQGIRDQLRWRINTHPHPSRLINQIALADLRCSESTQALVHLLGRSPKVLNVLRTELRKAFEMDPDSLIFTEPKPPRAAQKVDTLTDRALFSLVQPSVAVNVNAFTALSIKGRPRRRLPYTPLQALQRLCAMGLLEVLAGAQKAYWDTLVQGSWLTRRERWAALHTQLFADRAFIARQLDELSSAGMLMVQAVIDAPSAEARQRAGGSWASVQVGRLLWPGSPALAIPGALHLYREGEPVDAPHVLYLPGGGRNFHEYPSFDVLQCGLLELGRERFHELWQCLPLDQRNGACPPADLSPTTRFVRGHAVTGDALAQGAEALLSGQWANELACAMQVNLAQVFSTARPRPQPLQAGAFLAYVEGARKQQVGGARLGLLRDQLLRWDRQRRQAEIVFASTAPTLAMLTVERQVKRYEKGLVTLLAADDPSAQTPAYQALLSLMSQREVHAQVLKALMQDAQQRALELVFWAERPGGAGTPRRVSLFLNAQAEALRSEVELQHRLRLLGSAHRALMIEVIDQPLASRRPGSQTRVMSIAIGNEPDAYYPLHNVWVITTAAAVRVPTRQRPVVVYAFGAAGGLLAFSGLDALTQSLKVSLSSRDDSVLWGCVEHDKRRDLRAHAARETLNVRYLDIPGKPALTGLKKLLGTYDRLHSSTEDITRIFSEVTDAGLSRSLLMFELQGQLMVPANSALNQAHTHVELMRKVASESKKIPAWLAAASRAQRKHFRRLWRLQLSSAFAFARHLQDCLPDLGSFARRALTDRLRQDGMPAQLDIEQPLIDLPDDVQDSFCGWESRCSVGDRKPILTATLERTTFSLLQLALHNLDPLAPWTHWRFNRARYLQPQWQERLNAAYLIPMVASLDIGGEYDRLIQSVFYPPAGAAPTATEGRIPALLNRTLQAGAAQHLYSAAQQGLTASAQALLRSAMATRTLQPALQLHVVHLVGHTMQHDRYIAGLVVVQDLLTDQCVVYWPEAPQGWVLTEYGSLEQARAQLNRVGALPGNVRLLARQVAPGWAFEALTHHPARAATPAGVLDIPYPLPGVSMVKGILRGIEFIRSFNIKHLEPTAQLSEIESIIHEQIASDPQDWLAIVATSHSDAQALLYQANVLELQRQAQASSRSGKELEQYRAQRLGEQGQTRIRRIVAFLSQFFFPLFGVLNDVYELLLAARHYHRFGDAHDAVDVGFMSSFLIVDLLVNVMPGPKPAGQGTSRVARPIARAALGRIHRLRMSAQGGSTRLAPPPVMQLKALEHFKIKGVPKGAVALKGPDRFGIHVKDGASFVADDTHHYPVYRRGNEPAFRLKNPRVAGQNELILNSPRQSERLLGADAPQPVAGTSSGVLNPWRAPASAPPDWWPPVLRTATEDAILQSSNPATHWLDWRMQIPVTEQLSSPAPGVFHVPLASPGISYNALRVAPANTSLVDPLSGYYRLLPQGDQAPLNRIVFITRDEPLVSLASADIERWTRTAPSEQPLPASRTSAQGWQLHLPLFDKPLTQYVGEAFPTLTRKSQDFTVARMIELSGPRRPATATHLLNIRATLDKWLPAAPARPGQTDDLLRMLRPTERRGVSLFVGYNDKTLGFTRIDFRVTGLDPALRPARSKLALERNNAQLPAVRRVLQQQGFDVEEMSVRHGRKPTSELVATHPLSNKLYYIAIHWVERASIILRGGLTDDWFNKAINRHPSSMIFARVKRALEEGRLVRIVAGIQWPVSGKIPPSVYFVKVAPSP
ncbi:dermonecrotic toxin domain-containing protein [Pseudomonas sp. R11F]|uniref:dermonecrotic toxin domain-containing protein n=1 Tax=Pseudomonas TaxID=286 RepID=UPI00398F08FC